MILARSRITAQGQISVPASVRKKLGLGPGSVLEWEEDGENLVVKRSTRYSSEELHKAIFEDTPGRKELTDLKEGIRQHIRTRHARD